MEASSGSSAPSEGGSERGSQSGSASVAEGDESNAASGGESEGSTDAGGSTTTFGAGTSGAGGTGTTRADEDSGSTSRGSTSGATSPSTSEGEGDVTTAGDAESTTRMGDAESTTTLGVTTSSTDGDTTGGDPRSAGCGRMPTDAAQTWEVQADLDIRGVGRAWSIRLPENYDPQRAYPLVFMFHGCSNATNNVPMERVAGSDAVLVRGTGISSNVCWDFSATGPDVEFFDAMLATVEASLCIDRQRVFSVGYSSGAWLTNTLACVRGEVLRAGGTVSGGNVNGSRTCAGEVARIFIHDVGDETNVIAGSETERDRLLTANRCDAEGVPVPAEPAPCIEYPGCDADHPIVWCATTGQDHGRQDDFAPDAIWQFLARL